MRSLKGLPLARHTDPKSQRGYKPSGPFKNPSSFEVLTLYDVYGPYVGSGDMVCAVWRCLLVGKEHMYLQDVSVLEKNEWICNMFSC